jgi:hypothetical protein
MVVLVVVVLGRRSKRLMEQAGMHDGTTPRLAVPIALPTAAQALRAAPPARARAAAARHRAAAHPMWWSVRSCNFSV